MTASDRLQIGMHIVFRVVAAREEANALGENIDGAGRLPCLRRVKRLWH